MSQTTFLLVAGVSLALLAASGNIDGFRARPRMPQRVLSQAELQLFTTTRGSGEIVMAGSSGVIIDQGFQAVRVGTDAITFMAGSAADTEVVRIGSNGNVGIGTTNSATNRLTVQGAARLNGTSAALELNDGNSGLTYSSSANAFVGTGTSAKPSDGPVLFGQADGALGTKSGGQANALYWNSTGVGIKNNAPAYALDVTGGVHATANAIFDSKVGIGTNAPGASYALDVTGNVNFTGSLYQGGSLFKTSQWTTTGSDIVYTAGKIGIGMTNPSSALHVASGSDVNLANALIVKNTTTTTLAASASFGFTYTSLIGVVGGSVENQGSWMLFTIIDTSGAPTACFATMGSTLAAGSVMVVNLTIASMDSSPAGVTITTNDASGTIGYENTSNFWSAGPVGSTPTAYSATFTLAHPTNRIGIRARGAAGKTVRISAFSVSAQAATNTSSANVGVGSTAPAAPLHILSPVRQAGNTTMETCQILGRLFTAGVQNSMSGGFAIGAATSASGSVGRMDIMVAGGGTAENSWGETPDVRVATFLGSGQVGVGKTNPYFPLSVAYNGSTSTNFGLQVHNTYAATAANVRNMILFTDANSTQGAIGGYRDSHANHFLGGLAFMVGAQPSGYSPSEPSTQDNARASLVEAMRITPAGSVGIGITNPPERLTVHGPPASTYAAGFTSIGMYTGFGGLNSSGADAAVTQIKMGSFGPYIRAVIPNSTYADGVRLDLCTNLGSNDLTPVPRISIMGGYGPAPGCVGIGSTSIPFANCSLYVYKGTSTNWAGMGYFGGSTNGVVAGELAGVATVGAHNTAMNAWADLSINNSAMTVKANGNIGIGTTYPYAALHVHNYTNTNTQSGIPGLGNSGNGNYFGYWTGLTTWDKSFGINIGIFSRYSIVSGESIVSASDERIKKNIEPVQGALDRIRQLDVVSYDRIDYRSKSVGAGVLARNVQSVLPNAVNTTRETIPNIYHPATHMKLRSGVLIEVKCDDKDIKEGSKVKLMIVQGDKEIEHESPMKNWTGSSFEVEEWKEYSEEDKVFAYGVEVDDFLNVDKEQIGILAAGAVKELLAIVDEQSREISELKRLVGSLIR